jgi:hypothetical protein
MLPLLSGYQPLTDSRAIRRCPLLLQTNTTDYPEGRSVALQAPHRPKCPHSGDGSRLPWIRLSRSTKVPPDVRTLVWRPGPVKHYPFLFDLLYAGQVVARRHEMREICLRQLPQVITESCKESSDHSPCGLAPAHELKTPSHRKMSVLVVWVQVNEAGGSAQPKVGVAGQPRLLREPHQSLTSFGVNSHPERRRPIFVDQLC